MQVKLIGGDQDFRVEDFKFERQRNRALLSPRLLLQRFSPILFPNGLRIAVRSVMDSLASSCC